MKKRVIYWFRNDLRLTDNPALHEASLSDEVIPIYILTPNAMSELGQASKIWLHHSLDKLNKSTGYKIDFYTGNPREILTEIIQLENIQGWNKIFEPHNLVNDDELITELNKVGV